MFTASIDELQIANMFGIPQVTLFHRPTVASSVRVNSLLKRLSAEATETATEDQAADHSHQNKIQRSQFELNVTEDPPTGDQLRNLIEYVGSEEGGKGPVEAAEMLVQGAKNEKDAIRRLSEDSSRFKWPVVSIVL